MAKPSKLKKNTPAGNQKIVSRSVTKPAATNSFSDFNLDKWFPYIIVIFGFLLYANTLEHQYVLDDDTVVAKNDIVTKGIKAIPEILTTAYSKGGMHVEDNMYRPLSLIMFAIEWQLAPNKPFLGHLMNVLLYMLSGFLLYKLLRKWLYAKHTLIASAITLLFMAHPVHTEVVANIKSRDEILAFLFSILALKSFFDYSLQINTGGIKHLLLGTLFFFFALLSKESAVTIYAIIPLSIYFFADKTTKTRYTYIIGSISLALILYFAIRVLLIGTITMNSTTSVDVFHNSLAGIDNKLIRFCNALVMDVNYIRLFFFPHPLSYDYSLNTFPIVTFYNLSFIISILVITALIFYIVKNRKKKDAIVFGILFFGITLSVVANIFILIGANFAERFLYLPSLGLCIAVVLFIEKITAFTSKNTTSASGGIAANKIFSGAVLLLLILFSVKTFTRNADWKDNITLFKSDKDHNPQSFRIFKNYGDALFNKIISLPNNDPQRTSYFTEAKESLLKSIAITDKSYESWNSLGKLLAESNDAADYKAGIDALLKASELNPKNAETWFTLGKLYSKTGEYGTAISSFKKALGLNPDLFVLTYSQIGIGESYMALKQFDKAIDALEAALKLDNINPACYYSIGSCYAQSGYFQKAIEIFNKIENLQADVSVKASAFNNTGMCYLNLKLYDQAITYFLKTLNIYPNDKAALSNIIIAYTNSGNAAKVQEYTTRLQSVP